MKALVLLVVDFVIAVLHGIALSYLWGWFVVPVFALPGLSIVPAIGICLMVGMLTGQHIPRTPEQMIEMVAFNVGLPICAFVFGFICHLFM